MKLSPEALSETLSREARDWLRSATASLEADVTKIRTIFPAVSRAVGPEHADSTRIMLLASLGDETAEVAELYRFGDVAERRAILLSAMVAGVNDVILSLAKDAFRANDPRLVIAAANDAIVEALTDDEVDQVVVKCVFMEIPLDRVPSLMERTTASTSRMLAGLVVERVTAGRSVPADVWGVIDKYPPAHELELIDQLLHSDVAEQRAAAQAALESRDSTTRVRR